MHQNSSSLRPQPNLRMKSERLTIRDLDPVDATERQRVCFQRARVQPCQNQRKDGVQAQPPKSIVFDLHKGLTDFACVLFRLRWHSQVKSVYWRASTVHLQQATT